MSIKGVFVSIYMENVRLEKVSLTRGCLVWFLSTIVFNRILCVETFLNLDLVVVNRY